MIGFDAVTCTPNSNAEGSVIQASHKIGVRSSLRVTWSTSMPADDEDISDEEMKNEYINLSDNEISQAFQHYSDLPPITFHIEGKPEQLDFIKASIVELVVLLTYTRLNATDLSEFTDAWETDITPFTDHVASTIPKYASTDADFFTLIRDKLVDKDNMRIILRFIVDAINAGFKKIPTGDGDIFIALTDYSTFLNKSSILFFPLLVFAAGAISKLVATTPIVSKELFRNVFKT